jgi:hypothetical protein
MLTQDINSKGFLKDYRAKTIIELKRILFYCKLGE